MRNDALHHYYQLLNLACPGSFGSLLRFQKWFVQPIIAMVQSVDHEEAGRLACQRLQRKAAFVLSRGEEFLSKFLPPLHEILVLAQATPLQVSLLESLQGFSDMSMNDLEAGRQILASPSLLAGDKWDLLRRGVHMPNVWSVDVLQKHSGALSVVLAVVKSTIHESEDKLVISSYRWDELNLLAMATRGLRLKHHVAILDKSNKRRQLAIDNFNDPLNTKTRILLIPSKAAGVGINLIGANRLLMIGADWDPTNDQQLARRCWRAGQQNEVFVWRVVTQGCLDERILERGLNKVQLETLVSSAGSSGDVAAAATASKQRDTIARLIYAPGENCSWTEISSTAAAWTDAPSIAAARASNGKLYCLVNTAAKRKRGNT